MGKNPHPLKRAGKQFVDRCALGLVTLTAPAFAWAAKTGAGSDVCQRLGFLPLLTHFYSPVPEVTDLDQRRVWDRRSELSGINWRSKEQLELLSTLGKRFGMECHWSYDPTADPSLFALNNPELSFGYGCAASLHCMLRYFKPGRVIEVGSGNSSLVISAALAKNQTESGIVAEYTIVDPYPRSGIHNRLPGRANLIRERVELLDPSFFDRLGENDVLFVDTGHTVKIGGEVNHLFLDVLPRLAPGVIIHVHDIPLPYEYPKAYATQTLPRMLWTESYLLQAFLAFNSEFHVLLGMAFLMEEQPQAFRAAFPFYDPGQDRLGSGSFWMQRRSRHEAKT